VSGNGRLGAGRWRASLDGTYIDAFKSRVFATQPYVNTAGQWNSRDLFVRWKHRLSFTYSQGSWSGTLGQSYTSGYFDEKPVGTIPPGFNPRVEAYTVYNASVAYTGIKNLSISAGIKNLLNTDPPFTAHNVDFLAGAGWDPRVGDPRGRALTLRMTYRFF
jgi:iron complex outermembrane receptor protein